MSSSSTVAKCGNGVLEAKEECDNGGQDGPDGCDELCQIEDEIDTLDIIDSAFAGIVYLPFIGSSITYRDLGDTENFRRAALAQSVTGLVKLSGAIVAAVNFKADRAEFQAGAEVDFVGVKLGVTLFAAGVAANLVLHTRTIKKAKQIAIERQSKIDGYYKEYRAKNPPSTDPTSNP